jgi:hypothetical protein
VTSLAGLLGRRFRERARSPDGTVWMVAVLRTGLPAPDGVRPSWPARESSVIPADAARRLSEPAAARPGWTVGVGAPTFSLPAWYEPHRRRDAAVAHAEQLLGRIASGEWNPDLTEMPSFSTGP